MHECPTQNSHVGEVVSGVHAPAGPAAGPRILASMVAQVCHDLNNHLATLLGKAEVALMVGDTGRFQPALERVLEAGQPARTVVGETQRLMLWLRDGETDVPVTDAVATAIRLCERSCEKQLVRVKLENFANGARVVAPGYVAVLFWNVLHHVLQHRQVDPRHLDPSTWTARVAADGGTVRVRLEAETLSLRDGDLAEFLLEARDAARSLGGDVTFEEGAVEMSFTQKLGRISLS